MIKQIRNALYNNGATLFVYVGSRVSVVDRVALTQNFNILILLSSNVEHSQITQYWFEITYHSKNIVSIYTGCLIILRQGYMC